MKSGIAAGLAVLSGTFALAVTGAASAAMGSTAARDAASTRAFIGGELAIDRATIVHGPAELAAGQAYVASVNGDCGDVRLDLPRKLVLRQTSTFIEFVVEASAAFEDAALPSVRPAVDRVARADERLRFSDPTLQWLVHGTTPATAALLALKPPDLCADIRELQATKFKQLTPVGARFSKDALTLLSGGSTPGALIRRMRPYAPAAVLAGLQRLQTLNHRVARLPVGRVEVNLLRKLFGKAAPAEASSARVRSLLGHLGRAQL